MFEQKKTSAILSSKKPKYIGEKRLRSEKIVKTIFIRVWKTLKTIKYLIQMKLKQMVTTF